MSMIDRSVSQSTKTYVTWMGSRLITDAYRNQRTKEIVRKHFICALKEIHGNDGFFQDTTDSQRVKETLKFLGRMTHEIAKGIR